MSRVRRRQFLVSMGAFLSAPLACAQAEGKLRRIAYVAPVTPLAEMSGPEPSNPNFRAFLVRLRALGWIEGKNLLLDRRTTEGRYELAPAIFSELVKKDTEVIVVVGAYFTKLALGVTRSVPMVMAGATNPVEEGIVPNLANPGGNVTGVAMDAGPDFHAKRVEMVKEILPTAKQVALFASQTEWNHVKTDAMRSAARAIGLELYQAAWSNNTFDPAFEQLKRKQPDALLFGLAPPYFARRAQIVEFARKMRLPDFHAYRQAVEIGGLCSFGVDVAEINSRAAEYVDRILKGVRTADLPVIQPTRFETALNLKTAGALRIKVPPSMLLRADLVIE